MKKRISAQDLNGWDGYSQRGEAIYDTYFEQEKHLDKDFSLEGGDCTCGMDKFEGDEFCGGDYCLHPLS